MMKMVKATVLAVTLAAPMAATSYAQQAPVVVGAGNLVNVQVGSVETGDILSNITVSVGVAANIAANVCGVAVGVLTKDLVRGADFSCDNGSQFVDITQ